MSYLREIKTRLSSLQSTVKLTTAMKMISITRYKTLHNKFEGTADFLEEFLHTKKYFKPELKKTKKYLIVMSYERGLCGALRTKLTKLIQEKSNEYQNYHQLFIGKTISTDYLSLKNFKDPTKGFTEFIENIKNELVDFGEIRIIYTHYISPNKNETRDITIFPWENKEETYCLKECAKNDSIYTNWLNKYIFSAIYYCLLHSKLSENASRMIAMENATKNANSMIDTLHLSYNKQRQAIITREINDIGAGHHE